MTTNTDALKLGKQRYDIKDGEPLVQMKSITCRFGNLIANQNVDFDLARGEIHALLAKMELVKQH